MEGVKVVSKEKKIISPYDCYLGYMEIGENVYLLYNSCGWYVEGKMYYSKDEAYKELIKKKYSHEIVMSILANN